MLARSLVVWLLTLTGMGVSVPTSKVTSVWTETVAVCLRLVCIVAAFAVETGDDWGCSLSRGIRWLLKESSFPGVGKRNAPFDFELLHSLLELPLWTVSWWSRVLTFAACTFLWLLQLTPSWPTSPHFAHRAAFLQAFELWPYFWHLKQRRGFRVYVSTGTLR